MENLKSLDIFIDEQYGLRGSETRENFEREFEDFKRDVMQPRTRSPFSILRKVAAL